MNITLYHGSPNKLTEITEEGLFGGIFASTDEDVALSHADNLHKIIIEESEILTQQELDYHIDYEAVKKIIIDATKAMDSEEFEEIWSVVIEGKCIHTLVIDESRIDESRILEIFSASDLGSAGWEAQRIRGAIAKKLGYKAVEMDDEHGRTYLVLAGTAIINDKF